MGGYNGADDRLSCARTFLAVFVYATHATQAIAFQWKPGLSEDCEMDRSGHVVSMDITVSTSVLIDDRLSCASHC